jgi:uncharacterized protein YqjF (DUF2071 family)
LLSFLKNHPFAVEAHFESSLVLTYAVPKEQLQGLIPVPLTLDTFENKWAFLAVAVVKTNGLRPKGFPAFTGSDFILTGYRVFVRYTTSTGKRLRGLYIIKSETDKKKMARLGNVFTHYQYTRTDIQLVRQLSSLTVRSTKSSLNIEVDTGKDDTSLPEHSPFKDWKEARRFAGPLPFTFTYCEAKREMLLIEGVREDWKPRPVRVIRQNIGFLNNLGLQEAILASAFLVEDIPYCWKKGKKDLWKP